MKKLLVVVDFQNDFVDGSLGFPGAAGLEGRIADKIGLYRRMGDEIVFTFDTHNEDYLSTREGKNLPVRHCIRNTPGWELYGSISGMCDVTARRFEKNAFGSLELAAYLAQNKYDSVELVGLVSNICVLSNAVLAKAALPEAEIIVDASCTASYDNDLNRKTLEVMQGMQIEVINNP